MGAPPPRTQSRRFIGLTTPLGDDVLLLRRVTVTETLGRLFNISLEILSSDFDIDFDAIVGQNVTVRVDLPQDRTRHFNGYVSQFSQSVNTGRLASYRATVVPFLWFLTRHTDCRIFQKATVPDIIKEILKEHGYTDIDDRLTATYLPWEYCCEYRESDFNFISRLMEQEGIYYFFTHEDSKHKLVLIDSMAKHVPFEGHAELTYRPAEQALRGGEFLFDWHCEKTVQAGVFRHTDYEFKTPGKNLLTDGQITRSYAGSEFDFFDFPGEFTQFEEKKQISEGQRYARVRIEELQAEHEVHKGQTNSRGVAVGHKLTIADFFRDDRNREYLITSATHTFATDEFDATPHRGGGQPVSCTFTAIPTSAVFRPARTTLKPVIDGVQTATVCGKAGEEVHTDKFGRVMVKFPWDRRSKADETSSCWIRVSQAWAGKRWGMMFIPRCGQEVLVAFLEGDPDRPIIVGRVYNGEAMPPYTLPTHKTRSTIKTNSSKGGKGYNEIRFEDKKGKEQIYIHAEMNQDVRVDNDSLEWVERDRHMHVKRDQFEKVHENKHLEVLGDRMTKIGTNDNLTVDGELREKIGGNFSSQVGGDRVEKVGLNYKNEVTMTSALKALAVKIEASTAIELKCGGSSIVLTPAAIFIMGGPLVNINCGAGPPVAPVMATAADPDLPKEPKKADSDKAGKVDVAPKAGKGTTPVVYSAQAQALKNAAQSGAPFCEQCERARQAQEEEEAEEGQSGGGEAGAEQGQTSDGDQGSGKAGSTGGAKQAGGGSGPEGRSDDFKRGQRDEKTDGPPGPDDGVEPWKEKEKEKEEKEWEEKEKEKEEKEREEKEKEKEEKEREEKEKEKEKKEWEEKWEEEEKEEGKGEGPGPDGSGSGGDGGGQKSGPPGPDVGQSMPEDEDEETMDMGPGDGGGGQWKSKKGDDWADDDGTVVDEDDMR